MPGRSRYDGATEATVRVDDGGGGDGRDVAYLLPRVPGDAPSTALAWHRVVVGDRLDLLAVRYLGDPAAAWRIADANHALDPDALVAPDAEGRIVVVPVPGV